MSTTQTRPGNARHEAMADLGEIAGRMAHEIRNPLNAIRMQVAVIRNKLQQPLPENLAVAKTQLERLENEVLRVDRLAKAFLEFGRPPADEPEDIWLTELLEEVASMARPDFEAHGHQLTLDFAEDDADLVVHMDAARLRQVFMKLLANSKIALTSRGTVRLELTHCGDRQACLRVCDDGCGILPEDLPHVFTPFYSRSCHDEGLGLATVKRIVDAAGGTIQVESCRGHGTRFEILLPLAVPASVAPR